MDNCNLFLEVINKLKALEEKVKLLEKREEDLNALVVGLSTPDFLKEALEDRINETIEKYLDANDFSDNNEIDRIIEDKIEDAIQDLEIIDIYEFRSLEKDVDKLQEKVDGYKEDISTEVIKVICEKLK